MKKYILLFSLLYSLLNCASGGSNYKYSKQLSNIANPNETQFGIKLGNPLYPTKDMTLLAFDRYIALVSLDDETSFLDGFLPETNFVSPCSNY